ncbi:hypothetical protein [Streptomyces sp. MUM 203J]|uniref:hypothetical protein n=1 Tax=Streptomyces sp. MUM 203J TaxID=2791990 RepID=UPI001F03D41D|nr:hypothetical protein [Streptomyces sp. MUM 203J]
MPCVLPAGHEGGHRDTLGQTWAAPVETGQAAPTGERRPARRRPVRMCVECHRITDAPVVVSEVHQNSGPGFNVYACPDCASHFPPVPDALDLLNGWHRRPRDGDR